MAPFLRCARVHAQRSAFMIRVISIALVFIALTLALLPFQLIGIAFDLRLQRSIPVCTIACSAR